MIVSVKLTSLDFEPISGIEIPYELRNDSFWPERTDKRYPLLRWVERSATSYYTTTQMPGLVPELFLLRSERPAKLAQAMLDELIDLALRCGEFERRLLVFMGQ